MPTDRTPTLPNAYGGNIPYQCDSLSLLDVLCENEFERDTINQTDAAMAQVNFYKGAPPQWLNFYMAEREAAVDSTFIKRDGYSNLKKLIQSKRKSPRSIAIFKLLHEPSSGGSTLAMQVLWDMRKKHRCAVLKESTGANSTAIADQVINLFKAGDSQNTVLLLLEDENMADCLMREIAERKITSKVPVLIMLNCVRKSFIAEHDDPTTRISVILRRQLSEEEKDKFRNKLDVIRKRYADQHTKFHGFNIMCGNFSKTYIQDSVKACVNKHLVKPQNLLLPFLSLLNFYVPGSYLLESECAEFPDARSQDFESRMHPFNDLIVTFSGQEEDKRVRMKHPMIADQCVKLLAMSRVTRGDTTRNFLKYFCKAEVPQHLVPVIKDMLTKREITEAKALVDEQQNAEEETQDSFSKLIQDIKKYEGLGMCEHILKEAVDKFGANPFFPQALARLYYIEIQNYEKAEYCALKAKERAPNNSFIADTLGQVHKGNLRKKIGHTPCPPACEILEIAGKAIIAFKEEEKAAEKEVELESNSFNNRGSFGYLQVANYLFEALTTCDNRWKDILTGKKQTPYIADDFPRGKLNEYLPLIAQLKDGVKKRYEFFEKYLTYSKPKIGKEEPGYFHDDVIGCYQKYTGMMPISFPGLLSCLDQKRIDPNLQWMEQHYRTINGEKRSDAQATQNYILVNILLSQRGVRRQTRTIPLQTLQDMLKKYVSEQIDQPTEFHLLALMLFWPEGRATHNFPYEQTIDLLRGSFVWDLSMYFRSRYLVPLFLLGKGQGLSRLVHKSRVDILIMNNLSPKQKNRKLGKLWSSGKIWELEAIKDRLLRIRGVVEQYEIFLNIADNRIKIFPDQLASIRNPGPVSFYLGFNIGGPVAFNIKYEAK